MLSAVLTVTAMTPLDSDDKVVSVVYYRSGYGPNDYPTDKEWRARLLVERSLAVKCPTVGYQLVGAKKIQQLLANPTLLEKYVPDRDHRALLQSCFTGMYTLDDTDEGRQAVQLAMDNPDAYVMKPQREGGGSFTTEGHLPPIHRTPLPSPLSPLPPPALPLRKQLLWPGDCEKAAYHLAARTSCLQSHGAHPTAALPQHDGQAGTGPGGGRHLRARRLRSVSAVRWAVPVLSIPV